MFGITTAEAAVLALCFAGIVSAVVGRTSGLLSTREALVAFAVAFLLPVVGSLVSVGMLVAAWRERRRTAWTTAA